VARAAAFEHHVWGSAWPGPETPQGLDESIDVVAVVVGVEGDPEPARSTASDDPGPGSETFRGHPRILVDHADGTVTLEGRVLAVDPVSEVPLNRRYLLA
jgi:hypothetical protein